MSLVTDLDVKICNKSTRLDPPKENRGINCSKSRRSKQKLVQARSVVLPSEIFCKRDNICASFCCLSANSPLPQKSTRNKAIIESITCKIRHPFIS